MAPQRFTFTRAFPETPDRVVPLEKKEPTLTVSEHERIMAAAVAAAREAAFQEGRMQADGEATAHLARTMDGVALHLEALRNELDGISAAATGEAIRFAHSLARSLAGRLMDGAPLELIEDAARTIFDDLRGQPHVAARVAPELADAAREKRQLVARSHGFEGRLVVLGEPEIASGDIRIEWADGGIVRDRAAAERTIDEHVARALAAGGQS
ncbi:MAG: FliH/SctL family protein [Beijerinckiaceae bacterium]